MNCEIWSVRYGMKSEVWHMNCEVWTIKYELWSEWSVKYELWIQSVKYELRSVKYEVLSCFNCNMGITGRVGNPGLAASV